MKAKLPYLFIGLWFFAGASSSHVGAIFGGVLLSLAILLGMVSAIGGEFRRQGAAIFAIAVVLYVGSIVYNLYMAATELEIVQLQLRMSDTQAVLRQSAMDHRWAAFAYLLSLAGVMISGAIVLGGPKAWHGWLTSR